MDALEVFSSLGTVAAYRHPDHVHVQHARIEAAVADVRSRLDRCASDRDRLLVVLDVAELLVGEARRRSSGCQMKHADLGCENIDIETILAEWLEFARARIAPAPQAAPRPLHATVFRECPR